MVIYYFLSLNHYHGITAFADFKEKLTGYARHYLSGKSSVPSNAMDTALALCVMQNYHCSGQGLASYFEQLLSMQHSDGHWDRRVFYVGGPKMIFGWGSEELTTAICVEAIGRYIQGKQGGG